MSETVVINLEIEDAKSISHDLSDLLCWWEGFKVGMEKNGDEFDPVARHGIEAARKINVRIKSLL